MGVFWGVPVVFAFTSNIFMRNTGEVGKLLGAKWKEMDDSEKKPYIEQAARDKERAESEKAAYDVRNL